MTTDETPENGRRNAKDVKGRLGSRLRKATKDKLAREARQLVDVELMKALAHDLRVICLARLSKGATSPKLIASEIGEGLTDISYHVKALREYGLIEPDGTKPRRGAVEHFYKPVYPSLLPEGALAKLPGSVKQRLFVGILEELFEDAASAAKAKALDGREGSHVSVAPLVLDEPALKRLSTLLGIFETELEAIRDEANKRLQKQGQGDEGGVSITVGVASFESTRSPAESRKMQTKKCC